MIRQTGVYQKLDYETGKVTYIVISPTKESRFVKRIQKLMQSSESRAALRCSPELLHKSLITTYMANWQGYLAALEGRLLDIVQLDTPFVRCHIDWFTGDRC